ncbi:MAG: CoA transferase [Acidimicrobiia bacterium]|nr:CoA transferase [Acidimicrobiia bacterium]
MSGRPLRGCRVFDLTRFVSGSYATSLLAALGADVLKIELPPGGDSYRGQATDRIEGESALFMGLNGGKRSVAIDFRAGECRDIVEALLASSDLIVHNSRPGGLDAYGLDFASVHARHPHLVYGSISGYGDIGPAATRGGFDLILQAETGLMSVTGSPTSGPVKVGAPVLDIGAGLCVVVGLLAALRERDATGTGSEVSTSLLEFGMGGLTTLASSVLAGGEPPGLLGSHSPSFAPYGAFRASDDYVVLAGAGSEHLWVKLCETIARPQWTSDPRFATNADRVANRGVLTDSIEQVLATDSADSWVERLEAAGVPAGKVRPLEEVVASPQVAALDLVEQYDHEGAGRYSTMGVPFRLAGHRPRTGPSPVLGAHTREVLADLGVNSADVDELVARDVVVAP